MESQLNNSPACPDLRGRLVSATPELDATPLMGDRLGDAVQN